MITLNEINQAIDWIEKHPIIGAALIGSVAYTIKGITQGISKRISKESVYVSPAFWSFGKKYRITAVHKYFPSDDAAGYRQVQHSRPDQWQTLIGIESNFMNCRHKIIPNDATDVLAVIISRDGVETEKVINFNR